jgi:uroporphyrin-III C-methyltransferase/precorrin-2 dehydrogenase/sirohydrochlorin ferrochelatase
VKTLANLPVFLRFDGRKAVVAGAGDPSAWKAELLVAAGADVLLLAPEPSPKLAEVIAGGRLRHERRAWRETDFDGALVAIVEALDDAEAEHFRIAARRAGALVNAIDRPDYCDFSFGSIVERSPLVIAISTDGAAPVFAQAIRSRIEALFPESLRDWANAARAWRPRFSGFELARRRAIWADFAARALASVDRGPTEADYEALGKAARAGRLIVAGVGPGAGDLVTLRAVRALQAAEFIVEDGVIDPRVRTFGRREAGVEICRDGADEPARQRALGRVVAGETVVVLRPGDGRASEWESSAARAGAAYEIAPGVASP